MGRTIVKPLANGPFGGVRTEVTFQCDDWKAALQRCVRAMLFYGRRVTVDGNVVLIEEVIELS